jgi:hypothetical protein
MDHIDAHLTTASQDLEYLPAIRASLALGKAHLNKYYNMTDDSEIYRIAMSKYSILGVTFRIELTIVFLLRTYVSPLSLSAVSSHVLVSLLILGSV